MRNILLSGFICSSFFSCSGGEEIKPQINVTKEEMIEANIGWKEEETQIIDNFVRRRNWKMISTGTGLRYMIYKKGDTTQVKGDVGDLITINYDIRLIEGDTLVYSTEGEPEELKVAMDFTVSGMHEVLTYLRKGDRAKVIMPFNRAYGISGDLGEIPPMAPLLYDIEVLTIKKAQ